MEDPPSDTNIQEVNCTKAGTSKKDNDLQPIKGGNFSENLLCTDMQDFLTVIWIYRWYVNWVRWRGCWEGRWNQSKHEKFRL